MEFKSDLPILNEAEYLEEELNNVTDDGKQPTQNSMAVC